MIGIDKQKFIDFLDENDFTLIDVEQIPKGIVNIFLGMANCLIFPFEEMCDLILQSPQATENFCSIAYNWLFMLNKMYVQQRFDMRNQYACTTANKLLKTPVKISAIPYVIEEHYAGDVRSSGVQGKTPIGEFFAKKMAENHRTIQQSFSELTFYFTYKMETKTDRETFFLSRCNQEGLVSEFWHCPLV